jgi:hypothetical protein
LNAAEKIALTISIPSFCRPSSLKRQLLALDRELQSCPAGLCVDVVVRLNGEHEHQGLVEQLHCPAAGECLRILVNPANIGGNANIALGYLDGSTGGYIWVLSDNDFIRHGLLKDVYRALLCVKPDVLLLEAPHASDVPDGSRLIYEEMNSFCHHPLYGLGLISRGIYRVSYIAKGMESMFHYHNSSFPHLALVLTAFKCHRECRLGLLPGPAFEEDFISTNELYCDSGYDLSRTGGLQLITLLPKVARARFAKEFLFGGGLDFVRAFRSYPVNGMTTLLLMFFNWPLSLFVWPYAIGVDALRRIRVKLGRAIPKRQIMAASGRKKAPAEMSLPG